MSVIIETYACCLLVTLILLSFWIERDRDVQFYVLFRLILWGSVYLVISFFTEILISFAERSYDNFSVYLYSSIYYVLIQVILYGGFSACIYQESIREMLLHKRFLVFLPAIPATILALTVRNNHLLFYYRIDYRFVPGRLYWVLLLEILFLGIFGYIRISRATKALSVNSDDWGSRSKFPHFFSLYSISLCIGVFLHYLIPRSYFIPVMSTFGIVMIYTSATANTVSVDPLTGINNRQNLMRHIKSYMENPKDQVFLAMLDLNDFKHINDHYGHVVGDEVLCRVADSLKKAAEGRKSHPYVARFGGDEFMILLHTNIPGETGAMEVILQQELSERNERASQGKEASISIGWAQLDPETMKTPQQFIAAADAALYKNKSVWKKAHHITR